MTAVRSIKNQYCGINAHLHSLLQAEGGWGGFHTTHIGDLNKTLKAKLLPMGYTTEVEPSLQIRRLDAPAGRPESDVTIYDLDPERPFQPAATAQTGNIGALVLPIPRALHVGARAEKEYGAVKIYEYTPGKYTRGEPVTWVEFLSPSNKPGGRDYDTYREKRLKIVESGIAFVEIDYLHESAPTVNGVGDYQQLQQSAAHPYRILVIDPRPTMLTGIARVNEFDVDDPFPLVTIPLNAGDTLEFDFGIPYQKTYEETLYGLEWVDYTQLPVNFDRYRESDRARIVNRMLAVLTAAKSGVHLEDNAPLAVDSLLLAAALARLDLWK